MWMKFHGAFVAVITPFDRKGRVDRKNLGKLIEWHIQEGTQGIVCCGATGEGVALDSAEKKRVVSICVEASEGKIPIIAGCGTSSTKQSVQLTEQMQRLGANGCLIVTPYYNRPSQRGCILHFQEIAKVGLPVIAYHNPGRTAVRFTPETVAEIGKIPGVAALKDSRFVKYPRFRFYRAMTICLLRRSAKEGWARFQSSGIYFLGLGDR